MRSKYNNQQVCIISQDDFYHPRQHQKNEQGVVNFDLPTSLDLKNLPIVSRISRSATLLTWKNIPLIIKNQNLKFNFYSAPIIIVEGLFVFSVPMIRKMLDLKIYIEAKENLKVIRRIKRDQIERNYPWRMCCTDMKSTCYPLLKDISCRIKMK
ncbi:MAG: hypothetical protein IPF93_24690 [Saprospiraceae bacterium]|nr:hypothetical protein [Saprospiraceae bacterium]